VNAIGAKEKSSVVIRKANAKFFLCVFDFCRISTNLATAATLYPSLATRFATH
jgi:hypothetical protein